MHGNRGNEGQSAEGGRVQIAHSQIMQAAAHSVLHARLYARDWKEAGTLFRTENRVLKHSCRERTQERLELNRGLPFTLYLTRTMLLRRLFILSRVALPVCVCACSQATKRLSEANHGAIQPSGADSVAFVPLAKNRSQVDCSDANPGAAICRVRRKVDARTLATFAGAGARLVANGDELTAVYRRSFTRW